MREKKRNSKTLTEHVRKQYHRPGNGALMDESEIARALGEETRTVRTWRLAGIIPALILGHRTIRFKLDAVLDALAKRTIKEV
jgi:hypothetical protein